MNGITEEDARKRWCPFVRFADANTNASFNRDGEDPMNVYGNPDSFIPRCIGSACMAWRWNERSKVENPYIDWKNRSGFCGLAGKP